MRLPDLSDSWRCSCGVTVRYALEADQDPDEEDAEVVELDGVVHECDDSDDDDF